MRLMRLLSALALLCAPRAASAQAGSPLGPEFRVNTFTTDNQHQPAVDRDGAGNFVAVWGSPQDGFGLGVFGQRYAASGAPLGPEFRVNTFTTGDQQRPSVAVADAAGDFVVVWMSSGDGRDEGIFGQRYAGSGAPLGPEFLVNTWTTNSQGSPSVAADPAGNFVVVWQSDWQDGFPHSGVFGQRYSSSGIAQGAEFRVNTYTTYNQRYPAVTSDASGNFVVVWESNYQDGSQRGVFGQRYASNGTPLGPEFQINTYTTSAQEYPRIAADSAGDFVVVWSSNDQDGSDEGVFGQRYASSGAPLGPEFRVNTYTTTIQYNPSVASDAAGNFVVVWASFDNIASLGVFGQRYDDTGSALGPEFRVNTYTSEFQFKPDVASESSGNFVVVWTSMFQDGYGAGVFGQRYGPIVPVELMHFGIE